MISDTNVTSCPTPASGHAVGSPSEQLTGADISHPTLIQGDVFAKPKPDLPLGWQNLIDAIMALPARQALMKSALRDYLLTDRPLKEIAASNSYTVPALLYWVRKLGLERRQRGRRALLRPTPEHQQMLELVRNHGVAEAALRIGVSKQRVHEVVCRWAPELRGRRAARKKVVRPAGKHRVRRNVIVSFRITHQEWLRLLGSGIMGDKADLSGFAKARAIVLDYLGRGGASPGSDTAPAEDTHHGVNENVYSFTEACVNEVSLL